MSKKEKKAQVIEVASADGVVEGFEPSMSPEPALVSGEQTEKEGPSEFILGFEAAAEIAIAFAEQLAPGRNGGKRMREHFDAIRAQAKV